jgi:hypothetical protein
VYGEVIRSGGRRFGNEDMHHSPVRDQFTSRGDDAMEQAEQSAESVRYRGYPVQLRLEIAARCIALRARVDVYSTGSNSPGFHVLSNHACSGPYRRNSATEDVAARSHGVLPDRRVDIEPMHDRRESSVDRCADLSL